MKKLTLLLLLLSLLCACTGDVTTTPPPTQTPEPEATATPKPASTPLSTPTAFDDWRVKIRGKDYEYDIDALSYELVWSDEFDYEGAPDPDKWGYDTGGGGWGNNELQYYTAGDNAQADGEKLVIEARAEEKGGRAYTSTRLISKNKGDWLYGRIEVSAKLPSGLGTWPAIWMLPTDWSYGNWPDSGEIDILEHVGYQQDMVHTTVHTKAYNHSKGTQKGHSQMESGVSEEFHVYAIEWLPDQIRFFTDGVETYVYKPTDYTPSPNYQHWPFDKRFHLLINIALGGDWGGAMGFDEDCLPVTMEIDYVRVYQSPEITALTAG